MLAVVSARWSGTPAETLSGGFSGRMGILSLGDVVPVRGVPWGRPDARRHAFGSDCGTCVPSVALCCAVARVA